MHLEHKGRGPGECHACTMIDHLGRQVTDLLNGYAGVLSGDDRLAVALSVAASGFAAGNRADVSGQLGSSRSIGNTMPDARCSAMCTFPHDGFAFRQRLKYASDRLYESTGLLGQ